MADATHIEWTDATWNPVTGCSVVSPGCTNCYAMKLAGTRLRHHPSRAGLTVATKAGPVWNGQVRFNAEWLDQPLRWTRPRRIFVCAHGDLFHEDVPDAWIDQVFAVMALSPQHTFQVLTKRSARMRAYMMDHDDQAQHGRRARIIWQRAYSIARDDAAFSAALTAQGIERARQRPPWPLPNVWLGISAEDQPRADERTPELLATPAAVRFVSIEPMVGPVDLMPALLIYTHEDDEILDDAANGEIPTLPFRDPATTPLEDISTPRLDWVILGGESGPGARPMHPDWARKVRDDCAAAGVPFFFKQWGAWGPSQNPPGDAASRDWDRCDAVDNMVWRVGKKAAGRLLDGVEHNAMPEVRR